MAHDVFISYAKENKVVADAMCAILEQRQIRCWIAPRDVLPGQAYSEAIVEALDKVQVLVLIFSSFANASPQVAREVERAVAKRVAILPFRLEDVPLSKHMEYFISTPHWLDALAPPHEHHFALLGDAIEALLAQRQGKAPPVSRWQGAKPQRSEVPSGWNRSRTIAALSVGVLLTLAVLGYSRWQQASPPTEATVDQVDGPGSTPAGPVAVPEESPPTAAPIQAVAPPPVQPVQRSEPRPSESVGPSPPPSAVTAAVETRPTAPEAQPGDTARSRPRAPDEVSPSSPRYRRPERWQEYIGFDELVGRWRGQDRDGLVIEMEIPDTDAAEVQATVNIPSMACFMSVNLVQATEQFTTSQFYWKKITASAGCPDLETLYTNPVLNVMTWRFTFPSGQNAQIVMDRRI